MTQVDRYDALGTDHHVIARNGVIFSFYERNNTLKRSDGNGKAILDARRPRYASSPYSQ